MQIYVNGIGVVGRGFSNWLQCKAILARGQTYEDAAIAKLSARLLPATEKRRAAPIVHLAITAAEEAMAEAKLAFNEAASVFASSGGDGETIHAICSALATAEREVSPTRFHNSVHNAPAGYWCIGANSHQASTSLSCFDATFAAGLLEAVIQVETESTAVLLAAYDHCYPPPLSNSRPLHSDFSVALVLGKARTPSSVAMLEVVLSNTPSLDTLMDLPALEILRLGNPAARALPLLAAVVQKSSAEVVLGLTKGNHLAIHVSPCF